MVVSIAGLSALAAVVIALASWRHLATGWHLRRLRTDSSFLPEILRSERSASEERALSLFLETEAGLRRLFESCLKAAEPLPRSELVVRALLTDAALAALGADPWPPSANADAPGEPIE